MSAAGMATTAPRSRRLAAFAARLRLPDLPQEAVGLLKLCVLDYVGCAVGALGSPAAAVLRRYAERSGAAGGPCSLIGEARRAAPETAALANGCLSHILVFDDLHRRAKLHPGVAVIPAAWAAAELAGADGATFLAGIAAGYEVAARVGMAVGMASHRLKGWRAAGTCGSFGAAAAAARVFGLGETATHDALAAAAAQASGNWAFQDNGGMELYLAAGTAARNGVVAGLLAASGFRGAADPFEATDGGFFMLTTEAAHPELLADGLDDAPPLLWLRETCIKMYPTCHSTLTGVDAALNLRAAHGITAGDVEHAVVRAGEITRKQCGWGFAPAPAARMIFHMGYAIATALQHGKVRPADFEGDVLRDPEVARLARAIEIVADPELTAIYAERKPADLSLYLRDGRVLRERVDYCRGEPENPPTQESVVAKFRDLVDGVLAEADAGKLIDLIAGLEQLTDLRGLGDRLRSCTARVSAGR